MFQSVYRLFLTYGEMDPRRFLGPSEDLNSFSQVVVMSREFFLELSQFLFCWFTFLTNSQSKFNAQVQSFGRDLGSPNETDYVILQQVKQRTRDVIISWILEDAVEETEPPTTQEPTIEPGMFWLCR